MTQGFKFCDGLRGYATPFSRRGSGSLCVANCYFSPRLNNSPTHKKRPKAYAEPKADGLRRGGRSNLYDSATVDRGAATRARPQVRVGGEVQVSSKRGDKGKFRAKPSAIESSRLRRVPARELIANPRNWRRHPARQAAALRGVLEEVGYADALVCGELLLVARLNNSPTHEKRPKASAKPKAAGLSGEGGKISTFGRA